LSPPEHISNASVGSTENSKPGGVELFGVRNRERPGTKTPDADDGRPVGQLIPG